MNAEFTHGGGGKGSRACLYKVLLIISNIAKHFARSLSTIALEVSTLLPLWGLPSPSEYSKWCPSIVHTLKKPKYPGAKIPPGWSAAPPGHTVCGRPLPLLFTPSTPSLIDPWYTLKNIIKKLWLLWNFSANRQYKVWALNLKVKGNLSG